MAVYLLNSPVLTSFGRFCYSGPLDVESVRAELSGGFVSAVGHVSTARLLTRLLGIPVECSRRTIRMMPGDRAVVACLPGRLRPGVCLNGGELFGSDLAFSLLEQLATAGSCAE